MSAGVEPDTLLARVADDRASVYAALSVGFYLPDAALVWEVREGAFGSRISAAVRWLGPDAAPYDRPLADLEAVARAMRPQTPDVILRELRVDHARLFTGPGRPAVPAFESQYTDAEDGVGPLHGPTTSQVAAWYRNAGLERAAGHNDLPDYVATELEFLYALAHGESEARSEGRQEEARELRRETDRFLRAHPGRWMTRFAGAVLAAAPHPFYGALALLLDLHLATELGESMDRSLLPWTAGEAPSDGHTS